MNLLDMVRMGLLLLRASPEVQSSPITTVIGLTGVPYEMCQWIIQADADIQNHRNGWLFMRGSADLLMPLGVSSLSPSASLSTIRTITPAEDFSGRQTIGCYIDTPKAENRLTVVPYEMWYGNSMGRESLVAGRPSRCSINRDQTILFDRTSDKNYQITFDYIRKVTRMPLADASESVIPDPYRMAIVWWAIARYYCTTRDKTQELQGSAGGELAREMSRLHSDQIPPYTFS